MKFDVTIADTDGKLLHEFIVDEQAMSAAVDLLREHVEEGSGKEVATE